MNPEQAFTIARLHQHELRSQAAAARRASETPTDRPRHIRFAAPRFEFGRRVASLRMKIAHA